MNPSDNALAQPGVQTMQPALPTPAAPYQRPTWSSVPNDMRGTGRYWQRSNIKQPRNVTPHYMQMRQMRMGMQHPGMNALANPMMKQGRPVNGQMGNQMADINNALMARYGGATLPNQASGPVYGP